VYLPRVEGRHIQHISLHKERGSLHTSRTMVAILQRRRAVESSLRWRWGERMSVEPVLMRVGSGRGGVLTRSAARAGAGGLCSYCHCAMGRGLFCCDCVIGDCLVSLVVVCSQRGFCFWLAWSLQLVCARARPASMLSCARVRTHNSQ